MVAAAKEQLNSFVNSMFTEVNLCPFLCRYSPLLIPRFIVGFFGFQGLLDDQFCQLQMLQDANNPGFIAEVLALFCEDAQRLLKELATLLYVSWLFFSGFWLCSSGF